MRMQAVFLNKRSLVCGFSLSGETQGVLYLLKEAHKKGARTVIFTANDKDIYADFCSEVVLLASLQHLNHGNMISPQFPILVMIDIVYNYYIRHESYEKADMYDDTLRALESKNGQAKHIV